MKRWVKYGWYALALGVILIAVVVSVTRALTPWISQYKPRIEQELSGVLGAPVTISSMQTGWYWWTPVVQLNRLVVSEKNQPDIAIKQVQVGIELFRSLWTGKLQTGLLYADSVALQLEQKKGEWYLNQKRIPLTSSNGVASAWVWQWLLSQHRIILTRSQLKLQLEQHPLYDIRHINLRIGHFGRDVRLRAKARLQQKTPTSLEVLAKLDVPSKHPERVSGEVYVKVSRVQLAQWQPFFPSLPLKVDKGRLNSTLWFTLDKGEWVSVQGHTRLKGLQLSTEKTSAPVNVQHLSLNWAWEKNADGYTMRADRMRLTLNHVVWPHNAFKFAYRRKEDAVKVYVRYVLLHSVFDLPYPWPDTLEMLRKEQLEGLLHDTQFTVKSRTLVQVLSQFSKVKWKGNARIPEINHLAGAVYWEPQKGQLKIDSHGLGVQPKKQANVVLSRLNVHLNWEETPSGWQVDLSHLAIEHDTLKANFAGQWTDWGNQEDAHLQLQGELQAKEVTHWLQYLPKGLLKPKLEHWLTADVKRVDEVSATIDIAGRYADFPFDDAPGTFFIKSQWKGVDLYFAPGWPLSRDIDAYVQVEHRQLNADIVSATLQNAPVEGINLKINGIGTEDEVMLVRGQMQVAANEAKDYLLQSPLKQKLFLLNHMDVSDNLKLELQMQIPFQPNKAHTQVLGTLTFPGNTLSIQRTFAKVTFQSVEGTLHFDEQGLSDSRLKAEFFNHPVSVLMTARRDAKPQTEVRIRGNTTIDDLKRALAFPLLNVMNGPLRLEGLMVITDDPNDLDHLVIQSALKNVRVDLPKPFAKAQGMVLPLSLALDFNSEKGVRLRVNYADIADADIWLQRQSKGFVLKKGEMRVGPGNSVLPVENGFKITGMLSDLDVGEWQEAMKKMSQSGGVPAFSNPITQVDLSIGTFRYHTLLLKKAIIKATKTSRELWTIAFTQANAQGTMAINAQTHRISGTFDYLYLPEMKGTSFNNVLGDVENKPNVDVRIHALRYGAYDLGEASIQLTHQENAWVLEEGSLSTPSYQMNAKGAWQQKGKDSRTQLQIKMTIKQLAKLLERWHINPAVDAQKGAVALEVSWPGSYTDFSLSRAKGQLGIQLKEGQITHLGPEAEEKLGLGKLLSILSLQTIPRRLKLDFSDLANEGYTYDEFNGQFTLNQGVLTTSQSEIDGPVAYASMRGSLNVMKKTYDMELKISPHITASLPVVATIAGGPLAGAAVWVANKLINQGMQKINAYTYRITGPWEKPVVEQGGLF